MGTEARGNQETKDDITVSVMTNSMVTINRSLSDASTSSVGVTSTIDIVTGTVGNSTMHTHIGASSKTGLIVGITVPLVVIVAAAVITLICVKRKRRHPAKDNVRVWQIPGTHAIPRETSGWNDNEHSAEANRGFNPDPELQPSNIFTNQNIYIKHEEYFAEENCQTISRQSNDIGTTLFPPESKLQKESYDTAVETQTRIIRKTSKTFENAENTSSRDNFAEHSVGDPDKPGNKENGQKNADKVETGAKEERPVMYDSEGDDGQVTTAEEDSDICEQSPEILVSQNESGSRGVYTNVEVQKVRSMQEDSKQEPKENLPERVVNENKEFSSRPPKAQPRLSKQVVADPYDYPPSIPARASQNNAFGKTKQDTDKTAEDISYVKVGRQSVDDNTIMENELRTRTEPDDDNRSIASTDYSACTDDSSSRDGSIVDSEGSSGNISEASSHRA